MGWLFVFGPILISAFMDVQHKASGFGIADALLVSFGFWVCCGVLIFVAHDGLGFEGQALENAAFLIGLAGLVGVYLYKDKTKP